MKPLVVVNFKTYKEGTGKNSLELAKKLEGVSGNIEIILAVQAVDLYRLNATSLPLFVQHVDPFEYGAKTGSMIPDIVKEYGAKGTLINHSEKRIPLSLIKETIEICKKKNLDTIVCVENEEEAEKVSLFKPNFIAIEPKELIGGSVSVSEAEPELISDIVKKISVPLLCGAGIHTNKDFKKALELGAVGILISSSIVKSKDPEKKLKEILGQH